MSVFLPLASLGPEMAAPILWAPGIFWYILLENLGVSWSANFILLGVGILLIKKRLELSGRIKYAPNRGHHFVSPLPP